MVKRATPEEVAKGCCLNMQGFDDYPKSLRLFLHEYGADKQTADTVAAYLRNGNSVEIVTPDGKRHTLHPEPGTYYRIMKSSSV
jgi:hypothetical protein